MSLLTESNTFAALLEGGVNHLYIKKQEINDLNVFPIPDGDTGDNLYSTLLEGFKKVGQSEDEMEQLRSVAHGMLLGARGNSGVILSKIGAGLSRGFNESDLSLSGLVHATECAIKDSYEAVMHPKEGTMLTVFREAAQYANARVTPNSTLSSYLNDFICEGNRSVENTPNLLEVLKEASVVDSGGVGIVTIAEGMKKVLDGVTIEKAVQESSVASLDFSKFNENSELTYGYCTEFLLQLQKSKTDIDHLDHNTFADYLKEHGDSVVSYFEGSIFKVHVHTKAPGEILNHYQKYGEFLTVKIENMTLQHSSREEKETHQEKKKNLAVVAVAQGDGLEKLFREMGADAVISGGASANPSVEDFLSCFRSLHAEKIIVLPNNGNILLAAKEASKLYSEASVYVVESKDLGQGYAALSALDKAEKDIDSILASADDALSDTETYAISRSTRSSALGGTSIESGHYFAFSGKDKVHGTSPCRKELAKEIMTHVIGPCDVLLVLLGRDCSKEEGEELVNECQKLMKSTEIILMNGGQPLYDYLLIKE